MNISAISKSRIDRIIRSALDLWRHYSLRDLRKRLDELWKSEFQPLYEFNDAPLTCAVFGSGSFSTGRYEIYIAKLIEKELGWSPVRYTLIVTNRKKCKAKEVALEFKLPLVVMDFNTWYRQNYNPVSSKPTRETSLFIDTNNSDSLIKRFNIRVEFDRALFDKIKKYTEVPNLISLRGYNFPIMHSISRGRSILIDDTHPADLSITDRSAVPLCPGWQVSAVEKMRNLGSKIFRSSLIEVNPFTSVEDVTSLDTGKIYALTPGIRPPSSWRTVKIQDNIKRTEDYLLCAFKATGLFPYLWGVSKRNYRVEYKTMDDKIITKSQPAFIVGRQIRCGRNAFGRDIKDLSISI